MSPIREEMERWAAESVLEAEVTFGEPVFEARDIEAADRLGYEEV